MTNVSISWSFLKCIFQMTTAKLTNLGNESKLLVAWHNMENSCADLEKWIYTVCKHMYTT